MKNVCSSSIEPSSKQKLIDSDEALETILKEAQDFGIEEVTFDQSLGRILKENIVADRDFPPFDRVSMDGIGICFESFNKGQRTFSIEGVQAAGSPQLTLKNSKNCIEVMTGATLPKGVDTVIPYEQVIIENGKAIINLNEIIQFKNIHPQGKDKQKNDLIIKKNSIISAAEIGVLATVGKSKVKVARLPKVMIISTGDELVKVNETPAVYQIRRSNAHTLVALLEGLGIQSDSAHIPDNKETLKNKISDYLENYDVLLFSGAVSKGKFDFIPEILDELGVEKLFHKVAQRPGKPFWFGRFESSDLSEQDIDRDEKKAHTVVFAFPGNPISTFVSCVKYFMPWFQKSMELNFENRNFAVLAEDISFKASLTYFMQVRLENKNGMLMAYPFKGNGSGDLASLVETDAFIEFPADQTEFKKGSIFPVLKYRK
ncbi:MAG: molybdopterin molybdotransferase MoeA [Flavobacteriaceae bacterium]|nr:molybdopterin molybdotransferase MoeA [Flavobacteriaceae bacterium]